MAPQSSASSTVAPIPAPGRANKQLSLYTPRVYRYTCHGMLSASSDAAKSPKSILASTTKNKNNMADLIKDARVGTCRGLQSQMELIWEGGPSTRAQALREFTGDEDDEDDLYSGGNNSRGNAVSENHNPNSRDSSRDGNLAHYDEPAVVRWMEDGRANPALIYTEDETNDPNNGSVATGPRQNAHASKSMNDLFTSRVVRETWEAYGVATEVECLQLQDVETGKQEVVAVAPNNDTSFLSVRQLEMEEKVFCAVEVGVSPVKLQLLSEYDRVQWPQQQHKDLASSQTAPQESGNKGRDMENAKGKPALNAGANQKSVLESLLDGSFFTDHPSQTGVPVGDTNRVFTWDKALKFSKGMIRFSGKMVQQMESNANWLYQNLQDDFANRTVASGTRILYQMPKTAALFARVARRLVGVEDDDGRGGDEGGRA